MANKIVLGDKFHCVKDVVCEHGGNATEQNDVSQAFTYLAAWFIIEHNICEKNIQQKTYPTVSNVKCR